jgi:hypothetical protein
MIGAKRDPTEIPLDSLLCPPNLSKLPDKPERERHPAYANFDQPPAAGTA